MWCFGEGEQWHRSAAGIWGIAATDSLKRGLQSPTQSNLPPGDAPSGRHHENGFWRQCGTAGRCTRRAIPSSWALLPGLKGPKHCAGHHPTLHTKHYRLWKSVGKGDICDWSPTKNFFEEFSRSYIWPKSPCQVFVLSQSLPPPPPLPFLIIACKCPLGTEEKLSYPGKALGTWQCRDIHLLKRL